MAEVDWNEVENVDQWREIVRERFPGFAWALEHPELGPILEDAAEGEFTVETFNAQLRATDWFTSRTAAERDWDLLASDPANDEEVARPVSYTHLTLPTILRV